MPAESAAPAYDPEEEAAFTELRGLLLAQEQADIRQLKLSLESARSAEQISKVLPQAVRLAALRDPKLRQEMAPVIEQSIRLSVRRDPGILSDALLPLITDVVKKTVARAMRQLGETLQAALEQSLTTRSVLWRVQSLRSGRPFSEIVMFHSMLYRVEQVFLIHRETGLLLAKCSADPDEAPDAGLISAMLVAIQDFVRDSLGGEPSTTLDSIEAGEFVIWIQQGTAAILAGVIRGMPPRALRTVFETVLDSICLQRADALAKFSGEVKLFEPCGVDLQQCLLGKGGVAVKRLPAWPFWALAATAVALVLVYSIWTLWQMQHWRKFVDGLRQEPGIVVVEADRNSGRASVISGLRDPLARDPVVLEKQAGYGQGAIQFHWQPYLSTQPKFANARAYAEGVRNLESQRIYFPFDGWQIPIEEMNAIEQIAERVKALIETARRLSQPIRVKVVGHTDDAGTEQFNVGLAAKRSAELVETLVGLGVPRTVLSSSTALDRRSSFDDSERNRSFSRYVSLEVRAVTR